MMHLSEERTNITSSIASLITKSVQFVLETSHRMLGVARLATEYYQESQLPGR